MTDAIDTAGSNLYDFEVGGQTRVIAFVKTIHIDGGVDCDIYTFVGDQTHELAIYTLTAGVRAPSRKVSGGHRVIEGYVKGRGTLTVSSASGSKDNYYFETEGHTKEVIVESGQSVQWTAPNDSELVYYEVREVARTAPRPGNKPAKPTGPVRKLFLSSIAISESQGQELAKLVGKPAHEIKLALIENAADVEPDPKPWVEKNRQAIQSRGFQVELVDLRKYKKDHVSLLRILQSKDVIWVGGGNTFYLRWLLSVSRADEIIRRLQYKGVVYGGGSAGAIVAGPTLKWFEAADDKHQAPTLMLEGLNLINAVVVPHTDNEKYKPIMHEINQRLLFEHYLTIPLKDGQALVVDADGSRIISEP